MLHFDRTGELKRRFLLTAVERNRNPQLRVRALQEIAAAKDAEAFDLSIDVIGTWGRDERREGAKVMFQALAEKRIGRRDQANAWIWRLAEYTREVHEEYAVQRWPETKRLLGLLVNSSGGAHARNARRLVHAARKQDRRLQAALLAAAVAHTPEAEEVLRGARTRLARKPSALSRELLRNFPKGKGRRSRRRRKKAAADAAAAAQAANGAPTTVSGGPDEHVLTEALKAPTDDGSRPDETPLDGKSRGELDERVADALDGDAATPDSDEPPARPRRARRRKPAAKGSATKVAAPDESDAASADGDTTPGAIDAEASSPDAAPSTNADRSEPAARRSRRSRAAATDSEATASQPDTDRSEPEAAEKPEPRRTRARKRPASDETAEPTEPSTPPAEEAA
jgi:ribonuclease E